MAAVRRKGLEEPCCGEWAPFDQRSIWHQSLRGHQVTKYSFISIFALDAVNLGSLSLACNSRGQSTLEEWTAARIIAAGCTRSLAFEAAFSASSLRSQRPKQKRLQAKRAYHSSHAHAMLARFPDTFTEAPIAAIHKPAHACRVQHYFCFIAYFSFNMV